MVEISSSGKKRIQSNDGTLRIGLTERELRVTKEGVPAAGSENEDLMLNDNQNVFKIIRTGVININSGGDLSTWVSVPHGLSFRPLVEGRVFDVTITTGSSTILNNGVMTLPGWLSSFEATFTATDTFNYPLVGFGIYLQIWADATDIVVYMQNATGGPSGNFPVTYYLLQEAAA